MADEKQAVSHVVPVEVKDARMPEAVRNQIRVVLKTKGFDPEAVVTASRLTAFEDGAEESNRPGEKWQYSIQQRDKWLLITTEDNNVTAVEEIHEG